MLASANIVDDEEDSGDSEGEGEQVDDEAEGSAMGDEEEDDEGNEEDGEMEDVEANAAKAYGQKKGSSLYKAPTNEEMQSMCSPFPLLLTRR